MLALWRRVRHAGSLGGESGMMASWRRVSHAGSIEVIKAC